LVDKVQRRVQSEGRAKETYCLLCREEGKRNETARDYVTVRLKSGGAVRRIAVCRSHADGLGRSESPYEVVAAPARGVSAKGLARESKHVQGKSEQGNINRSLRRAERFSKGARGRLGE
jgi:hypothetical protein